MDAKQARKEYMKKWRAENKDKTIEYQNRFWEKRAKELAGKSEKQKENI